MLQNYLNIALRNIAKHRLYSVINILGLGVGLAACVLITLFVRYELSYDHQWSNADSLYRVHTRINIPGREPFVTVVDQGTLAHERGAINYDDEGNPSQRNVLVENGILKAYLQDNISARHYKLKPTGSGRRESYKHNPMPRMTCTFMEDGPHSQDEMIASMNKGIIAETYTNGQVQIGAGDFTFYIKNGWLVENGKVTAPIKDCNIIGNGPEVLKRITMVAGDGKLDTGGWTCGKNGQSVPVSQGMPSVLVSSMTVGGEHVG